MKNNAVKPLIISQVSDCLKPHIDKLRNFYIDERDDKIEVRASTDDPSTSAFVLIRIVIHNEWRQVFISNIYLPLFLRHKGIGMQLIKVVFLAAKRAGYELFVVQMVDSFYARMIRRGALKCDEPNMVQVTDQTKLE